MSAAGPPEPSVGSRSRTSAEPAPRAAGLLAGRDRAVSAVVGKALEAGIVVLYASLLAATLYGGVVPEYERAAGAELGERVLAEAAVEVQTAVPEDPRATATVRHDLPRTIDGSTYRVAAGDGELVLHHPDPAVGGSVPLALPPDVDRVVGAWDSHERGRITVERTDEGRVVRLEVVES